MQTLVLPCQDDNTTAKTKCVSFDLSSKSVTKMSFCIIKSDEIGYLLSDNFITRSVHIRKLESGSDPDPIRDKN